MIPWSDLTVTRLCIVLWNLLAVYLGTPSTSHEEQDSKQDLNLPDLQHWFQKLGLETFSVTRAQPGLQACSPLPGLQAGLPTAATLKPSCDSCVTRDIALSD